MRKNIIRTAFVAAFALMAGYNVYTSQQENTMSDFALANVEALASGEENPLCLNGCLSKPGSCFCYGPYPYEEKQWK